MPPLLPTTDSIFETIKHMLQVPEDLDEYDLDITVHINSAFFTLFQLGVGPQDHAFAISTTEDKWSEFMPDEPDYNAVKTYVYQLVKLAVDPPATSFAIDALKEQIREFGWRLNVQREGQYHPWSMITPLSSD